MTSAADPSPPPPAGDGQLAVRAFSSSAWTMAGQAAQVVLSLGTFALLSRWLTPADYGLFGMAATVTGIVGIIGDGGVGLAIARRRTIEPTDEATGFWLSLGGGGALMLISAAAAPILARFYRTPAVLLLGFALGSTFFLAAPARVSLAKLSRQLRFKVTTLASLAAYVGATALTVLCARRGWGAWALVIQMAATIVLTALFTVPFAVPRIRPSLVSRERARELSKFGWQMSGYSMTVYLGRSLEGVFAGRYLGSSAVGLLAMGTRLIYYSAERLSASASAVFVPTAAEIDDLARQGRAFLSATRLLYMVVAPFCLGSIAVAPELVAWLPPKWAALAPVLRVYALGTLFSPMVHLSYSILTVHGKSGPLLRVALAMLPVAWIGALAGSLAGSVIALVFVWDAAMAMGGLMQLALVWKILSLRRDYWRRITLPLATSAVMALVVHLTLKASGLQGKRLGLLVGGAVGMVVYVALAWVVMRPDILRVTDLVKKASLRRGT